MANQFATNYPIPTANNPFPQLWKLSRLMKAAGWQYRASSTGQQKDTSGIAANDMWGGNTDPTTDTYGLIIGTYTGTDGLTLPQSSIAYTNQAGYQISPNGGTVSIWTTNGWQSVTYTTASGAIGGAGTLTGCSGGTGTLMKSTNSTSLISQGGEVTFEGTNPGAWWVASGPLTVKVPISSAPSGIPVRNEVVTQTGTSALGELLGYVWDPLTSVGWATILPQHTPENTTIAAGSDSSVLPQSIINVASTTGFASSGYVNVWASLVSTTITVTSNGHTLTSNDTINVVSTTNFPTQGYLYVQTSLGYQKVWYEATTASTFTGCNNGTGTLSTGGLVYGQPSLQQITYTGTTGTSFTGCSNGSGAMFLGNNVTGYSAVFNNSGTLTGNTSNATFSPTGTIQYFQREVMFSRSNGPSGVLFYVAADGYAENNQLFSTLAAQSSCTPTVPPGTGFSTPNNLFPPLGICLAGNSTGSTAVWFGGTGVASNPFGYNSQIGCINAIPSTIAPADGSFYAVLSTTANSSVMTGIVFTRIDDGEPGDLDPYAWFYPGTSTFTSFLRTSNTANNFNSFTSSFVFSTTGAVSWIGYQARGCGISVRDVVYGWTNALSWSPLTTANYTLSQIGNGPIRQVAHPAASTPLFREMPLLYSPGTTAGTFRQVKGRARWVAFFPQGGAYDTFDNKTWLAVLTLVTGTNPCMAIGPYDGATTPIP